MARGGAREGAGRPPVPEKESKAMPNQSIRCTDAEKVLVKEFLKKLRNNKKPTN